MNPDQAQDAPEAPVHMLDLHGGGAFARGRCTACTWVSSGAAADIRAAYATAHVDNGFPLLERVTVPYPIGNDYVDWLEKQIIRALCDELLYGRENAKAYAAGLATARAGYLAKLGYPAGKPAEYVSVVLARLSTLSNRQRGRLRDENMTRVGQQVVFDS